MDLVAPGLSSLPGQGIEPVFSVFAGGFLSTIPPGKSRTIFNSEKFKQLIPKYLATEV